MMMADQKGFTLVELLAVIGIIAILAFLALPRYNVVYKEQSLYTAARQLAVDVRYARATAVESTSKVTVNVQANRYDISSEIPGIAAKSENLPAGIQVENPGALSFDALGNPVDASGNPIPALYTFNLKDIRGQYYYVKITPVTGKVTVDHNP